jgi:hypothetical protein
MTSEKQIEQYLVKECKKRDWLCWKFTSPGTCGVPDRIIIPKKTDVLMGTAFYHAYPQVYFAELKSPKGKLSELQKKRIAELGSKFHKVAVINSKDEVDELVDLIETQSTVTFI